MSGLSLTDTFKFQAEWRREKAKEHPDDERNLEAATIFDRLALTVDNIPPDVLIAYHDLFDDLPDTETEQEMLRAVGFHSFPASAEEFVREFIAKRTF
jgi:hypothetical protein